LTEEKAALLQLSQNRHFTQNPALRLKACKGLVSTVNAAAESIMRLRRSMKVELTKDERGIINNALNKVSNGIDLEGKSDTPYQ
jgi:hypothetical protein